MFYPQDVQPLLFLGTSFPIPQSPKLEARLCETEKKHEGCVETQNSNGLKTQFGW